MPVLWDGRWLNPWTACQSTATVRSKWTLLFFFAVWLSLASAMSPARIAELRKETVDMFYHGFDNYMDVAFPEDEVRGCLKGGQIGRADYI